jgi:hypothetical protein
MADDKEKPDYKTCNGCGVDTLPYDAKSCPNCSFDFSYGKGQKTATAAAAATPAASKSSKSKARK